MKLLKPLLCIIIILFPFNILAEEEKEKRIDLVAQYQDMLQAINKYEQSLSDTVVDHDKDLAVIFTQVGYIAIHFNAKEAKKSLAAVRVLVESGFYDDLEFFRGVEDYFIQFGDPSSSGGGGSGVFVPDEFSNTESHVRGTVSMANFNTPNSQDSQLFIVLNRSPWLNGKNTIIGTVIYGIETANKISKTEALENGIFIEPKKIIKMVMFTNVDKVNPEYYNSLEEKTTVNQEKQNAIVEKNLEYEKEIQRMQSSGQTEEPQDEPNADESEENTDANINKESQEEETENNPSQEQEVQESETQEENPNTSEGTTNNERQRVQR